MKIRICFASFVLFITTSSYAEKAAPEKQIDIFFESLRVGGADGAFNFLISDSLLGSQKGGQMEAVKVQFDGILRIYGKASRFEIGRNERLSDSLLRIRGMSFHNDGIPLFWNFVFLKRNGQWEVLNFSFNDDVTKVFPAY